METVIVYWHWFALAVLLGILDVLIGTNFFLVWCGLSAAAVGAVLFLFPHLAVASQLMIFGIGVFCSYFAWRHFAKLSELEGGKSPLNQRSRHYVGRHFTLEEPIVNGRGRIRVDDSFWRVEGPDLPLGARVEVIDADGVVLKVKPLD